MTENARFDVLLRNARILDGTGGPWLEADLAVEGDRIAALGALASARAALEIDCAGASLAPGFIDAHSHSDLVVFEDGSCAPKLMQGVTTELLGQDGIAAAPIRTEHKADWRRHLSGLLGNPKLEWAWSSFDEYLSALENASPGTNLACLAPHGNLRLWVMGMEDRKASPAELEEMASLLRECMEAGAVGLSTGLIYPPCSYADEDELAALCAALVGCGGFLVVHMRSEDARVFEALGEMLRVSERSSAPLHISHLKVAGRPQFGRAGDLLAEIERARERGVEVTFDQYPYTAGSTMLFAILPEWLQEGGPDAMIERLGDAGVRERIVAELAKRGSGAAAITDIRVAGVGSERNRHLEGRNLLEVAEALGKPLIDAVCDLLIEEDLNVSMILFIADEGDVQAILRHPLQIACTDGLLGGKPHPRLYGTFPRILGHYCRELGVLPLPEAVRKMTSAPAARLGLRDRGILRPGMKADLVVFDPERVIDRATYDEPRRPPEGILHVFVNGRHAVRHGELLEARAGRVLRSRPR
jgi:N-acyl-D-amino-acid deacylase